MLFASIQTSLVNVWVFLVTQLQKPNDISPRGDYLNNTGWQFPVSGSGLQLVGTY